jgi:NAD-dependent dihydropyrimidine dehydrogenase PreA subunit
MLRCEICVEACLLDVIQWDDKEGTSIAAYLKDSVWCYA